MKSNMKKIILLFIFSLFYFNSFSQSDLEKNESNNVYKLFPTENIWNFIKLNTRTGQMWQVQFDVSGNNRFVTDLWIYPLVKTEDEINNRFTLYPTQNTWNFILLDQIEGNTYQVQWSMEPENRGVILIE